MQAITFSCTIFIRFQKIDTLFYDTFTILRHVPFLRMHRVYSVRLSSARIVS